ncbi:head maturation protease, ClpP-related [Marinibacterium sp. SX1]|uniref:head maturation protease, ClpP-related n=1 Tax=Marinibacterium sp. SX1 TaxID=3388424 RepID=UPI003D168A40
MNPEDLIIAPGQIALDGYVAADEDARFMDGGGFSPAMVRNALRLVQGDVTIWVNSRGGDPHAGEAIRAMIAGHAGETRVIVAGMAASAASLLIMGAARIEMTAGSLIMIHDPHSVVFGDAASLRSQADALDVMAATYARVYAARAGMGEEEVRDLMRSETWFSPDAAIATGFADAIFRPTEIDVPAEMSAPAAGQRVDEAAARRVVAAMCRNEISRPGAEFTAVPGHNQGPAMAATGVPDMEPEEDAVVTVTPDAPAAPAPTAPTQRMHLSEPAGGQSADAVRAAERTRNRQIMTAARPHLAAGAFDEAFVDGLIDSGVSYEMASAQMLERLAAAQPDIEMASRSRQASTIVRDERDTRREGLTIAMSARLSGDAIEDDRARPYASMSMHEMAAAALGRSAPGFGSFDSRERVLMDAFHTSSDFPNILSTSVNRILERQYELTGRTFTQISREMTFNDFRTHDVVRPDEFPTLTKINETGEIKFGSIGDSKETVALASYGTGLSISRQALVNDDLGAIQDVLDSAASIVPEFEESTFWTVFLQNSALADGVAMFHADHGNLAGSGSAISVTAISAGRKALRQMKAADGKRVISMNAPTILLVGPAQETAAEQFVAQAIVPTKASDTNPFTGKLTVVVTEEITDNSWYLLVPPAKRTVNFRHGYLRDRSMPRVRVAEPFGQQGLKMTLEHDFGVGGVNYRGGFKNPGA